MTHSDVQIWLDRYIAAWQSYDPKAIGDLFSENCEYRYQPWADPVVGRDAIVKNWLDHRDEPGTWSAHYDAWTFDGERASAIGQSRYTNADGSLTIFSCASMGTAGASSSSSTSWSCPRNCERVADACSSDPDASATA